jgi:type III pantothenate kinase
LLPDTHCLVIDCGTCVKYELLTADGHYRGGNIAPGLHMRTEAMHHFTARLPVVERALPDVPVGNSTQTALQNGAFRGALLEMAGFVRLFADDVAQQHGGGPVQVVLTGGDAGWVLANWLGPTTPPPTLEPELTLIGLNEILTWNTAF